MSPQFSVRLSVAMLRASYQA